jgi:hypothetical protein
MSEIEDVTLDPFETTIRTKAGGGRVLAVQYLINYNTIFYLSICFFYIYKLCFKSLHSLKKFTGCTMNTYSS